MKENRALSGGLCALGCEVLYGLSYLFTKRTADAASALALLGWRFIVALAVMSLCVALGLVKIRLRGRRLWPLLRVALFCPCLYFIGETVGIRETTVTESGVFLACVPALSLLASAVILKKKPTRRQAVGISITFLGVMTTVIAVGISSSLSPMGYAALMLAVAAYALYSVFVNLASDYTGAEITYAMLLSGAVRRRIPLVIGTTGMSGAQGEAIRAASRRIPIVWSENFSVGVTVLARLARLAARALGREFDMEIVETHHNQKADAPSGTAKLILRQIDPEGLYAPVYGRSGRIGARGREIGVHAVRGGTAAGEHSLRFFGRMEELELRHRADSREIFAQGALRAAAFARKAEPGLYDMEDVLFGGDGWTRS